MFVACDPTCLLLFCSFGSGRAVKEINQVFVRNEKMLSKVSYLFSLL